MRKICLSGCFKNKMSRFTENIWKTAIAMAVMILGAIVTFAVLAGTGYVLSFFFELEMRDWLPYGIFFYITLGVLYWIGWLLFKVYKKITSETFKLVKEKYEGSYDTCSIFEYCDEPEINQK